MDLFKWVGRKKREEEWMRTPRQLPAIARELPENSPRWMVTQEFVNDEDKNLRYYLAVFQPDPNVESWRVYHVQYDLKHIDYINASWSEEFTDPMDVVKALRGYERKMKHNSDFISHPENRSDYRGFANKYGIHFDDDGNVFRVVTESPLAKGTFMNREALDKLFHKEAAKMLPLDSWEGIYKGIVEFRSPEWTMNEKAFGVAEQFQSVSAVAADTQYEARGFEPSPTKILEISSIAEIRPEGGIYLWKGDAATIPTPEQIQEAQQAAIQKRIDEAAAILRRVTDGDVWPKKVRTDATPPASIDTNKPAEEKKPELPAVVIRPAAMAQGKTLQQLAQEKPWAGHKEMQQLTWKRQATFEDVTQGKGYPEYAFYMKKMIEKLKKLPEALTNTTTDKYAKELAVKEFSRFAVNIPFRSGRRNVAKHDGDATILVGMLRAGAAVYAENFGPGKKFSPDGLALMSTIGKLCVQFAIDRLGVTPEDAAKIADVITKGSDPFGPELPLEKALAKYPAEKFTPAPPPQAHIVTPTKKKPEPPKRRSSWNDGW